MDLGLLLWCLVCSPLLPRVTHGKPVTISADYDGPALLRAWCVLDGERKPASYSLQSTDAFGLHQRGELRCEWPPPPVGDHVVVIIAESDVTSTPSAEFQFVVVAR